ncbi:unnamed protein product [Heterobilharzia americana]|nr:unnamed protein product [Heterobilharzia americana]
MIGRTANEEKSSCSSGIECNSETEFEKGLQSLVQVTMKNSDRKLYVVKWVPIPQNNADLEALNRTSYVRRYPSIPSREIYIFQRVQHKNVVKFIKLIQNPHFNAYGIVLEYLSMGSLNNIPDEKVLTDRQISEYFQDILDGLQYLHSEKIIHRDVNPSNILITNDDHLKITDFSMSVEFTGEDIYLSGTLGTPEYLAPECVNGSSEAYKGKPVDVWAMGMTLYWIIYRQPFYNGADKYEVYESINTHPVFINNKVSDLCLRHVLERIFQSDPELRICIAELQMLTHNK